MAHSGHLTDYIAETEGLLRAKHIVLPANQPNHPIWEVIGLGWQAGKTPESVADTVARIYAIMREGSH